MPLTEKASGTQTAVVGTEHTLLDTNDLGVYVLEVDANAMALGDVVELRIYSKVTNGGTTRLAYEATYAHVQGEPNKYSVPVPAMRNFKATLKQTAGVARSFPWTVLAL
jgi:hypothetical protein